MQMQIENKKYDIVIIGAGISGCLAALLLAKNNNLNILIIDKKIPDLKTKNFNDQNKYQQRVVAINLASKKILESVNVWQMLPELRLGGMRKISVTEENGPQKIEFDGYSSGYENLAYVVENDLLLQKLFEKIYQHKKIEIQESQITNIQNIKNIVEINLENNLKINANLVIAADGGNSFVREYFNLKINVKNYNHTALVANIFTDKSHENTARQKFLKSGPIALLPLGDVNNLSIVLSTNSDEANRLLKLDKEEFCLELNRIFNFKIGNKISLTSERFSFPLFERHLENYHHGRIVFLGDAAHTIHPLAGQGLNLGILDANVLAEEILNAHKIHGDYGNISVLKRYQSRRKGHNQILIYAMRFFKDFYSNQKLPVSILRNLGVGIINNNSFIKDKIIKLAVG